MTGAAEIGAVVIVFTVIGVPVLAAFGIIAYRLWLRNRQLQLVLDERKLLIEKGVTDLPSLELPETRAKPRERSRFANLKAGIILLFIAAALLVSQSLGPGYIGRQPFLGHIGPPVTIILAALGFALLLIHFLCRALERRNGQQAAVPAQPEDIAEPETTS